MSQDAAAEDAFPYLRTWARYLDENHDLVIGLLDELVKNVVGSGIVTIPKPMNEDGTVNEVVGAQIMERRRMWAKRCDVTGELSWPDAQRLICRAWFRDGEHFVQHVTGEPYPFVMGETPYRLELLESDMVPHELTNEDTGWRQGVRLNEWRQPREYAVYRRHPGDKMHGGFANLQRLPDEAKVVEAARLTHLKLVKRWPAVRGISVLHGIITRLYDMKDVEESERVKNRLLASWCAAIQRSPEMAGYEQTDEQGQRYTQVVGGTLIDTLAPGETITGVGPTYPTGGMEEYVADQLRRIAAGAGVRYSSIARRYDGSYSAQRQELVETEGHYKMREDTFTSRLVQPVHERLVLADVLAGHIVLPPEMTLERATMAEHRGPGTPWIDQLKEVQADALAVAEGFATQEQIQIKRGAAPELIGRPAPARPPAQLSLVPDDDEDAA